MMWRGRIDELCVLTEVGGGEQNVCCGAQRKSPLLWSNFQGTRFRERSGRATISSYPARFRLKGRHRCSCRRPFRSDRGLGLLPASSTNTLFAMRLTPTGRSDLLSLFAVRVGQSLSSRIPGDSPNLAEARGAIRRIARDGIRAGDVIARMRALFKKAYVAKERLNLNEAIEEVVVLTQSELWRNKVALRLELAADLPSVMGDRVQLQQVVVNLILNSIQAMSTVKERNLVPPGRKPFPSSASLS